MKQYKTSSHILWLLTAACSFIFLGCTQQPTTPIRIGINAWPGYEFLYLAHKKGYYQDAGLEARVIEFNSLSDARRAYEREQIDAVGTTVVEVLQARDQSHRPPQIIRIVDYSNGADVICMQPHIKTNPDMRGARIGVELASLGVYGFARALSKHGLTLDDVQPISMEI